ncbi:MAG: TIGR03905 family TSCPD domain-containing protein [Clostridia bacterium]|uniref:TIGR03905 family TSCPD domain-containing protein n=1 Tax=Mogibacterium sp. TaxID=2049035 RepID=UPI00257F79A7|nr:TIGR03905 family TSCPD domain-containing protein [Mogibacterium sp.]MBN2935702.1 TIGR03905 family TSCPD domain-containing protein [Mogibacterium sp.]MEE0417115.1 TIGR03905 family TSCPD domain-containing protein [Clostridia bacterium]
MNQFTFRPQGVCSQLIEIETEGNIIQDVRFTGGCNGNLQGISALLKGMTVENAIDRLSGIHCGFKDTSCPDQLSRALKAMQEQA